MISPTEADRGRKVVYRASPDAPPEEGWLSSFNSAFVFVRYGNSLHGVATRRTDLEWSCPTGKATTPEPSP